MADEIPPAARAPCSDVRQPTPVGPDPWMGTPDRKEMPGNTNGGFSITRRIFDAKKDNGNLAGWLAKCDEDGPCNAQDLEPGFFSLLRSHVAIVRHPDSRRRWMGEIDVTSWPCPRVYARIYYTGL